MKKKYLKIKFLFVAFALLLITSTFSQTKDLKTGVRPDFWKKVQFGGGIGLNFGNTTNISLSPTAIYNINKNFSLGAGLQGSYVKIKYNNPAIANQKSTIFGASIIGLYNPIDAIQLSAELEELNVNTTFDTKPTAVKDNYWNTAMFAGAGYRVGGVVIGARYNLLYDKNKNVYGTQWMPFVRAYF